MNISNEEKLPLKDMKPEEIKEIANTLYENMEFLWRGIEWKDGKVLTFLDPDGIYRTKPKKLTVNELFYELNGRVIYRSNPEHVHLDDIKELFLKTEGFSAKEQIVVDKPLAKN